MSILINGMEMPIGDDWRTIKVHSDGSVWRVMIRGDCALIKDATAIPLPEGHGRLIDADALAAQFKKQIANEDDLMELCRRAGLMSNYFNESKVQIGMVTFMRMLNDAKTILPAEGGNS